MERYQKIEKNGHVGAGTYGVVYKALDKQNNDNIVALKVSISGLLSSFLCLHGLQEHQSISKTSAC
jgi:serine/threonine protein kinase